MTADYCRTRIQPIKTVCSLVPPDCTNRDIGVKWELVGALGTLATIKHKHSHKRPYKAETCA